MPTRTNDSRKSAQRQRAAAGSQGLALTPPAQMHAPNRTGLPDALKSGVENLSGLSLDDVRVHYNSPKPAGVQALAYTQGTDIHVAPGQERHLPHEAWHVVQQKQGRVKPTLELKGQPVNDESGLEREADRMGRLSSSGHATHPDPQAKQPSGAPVSIQRQVIQRHTIGNLYSANPVPSLATNLLKTLVGDVAQGAHITRKLQPGEYIQTYGFTACTVLVIWDPVASVASLAHFDDGVEASNITDMINEMLNLGATVANLQFAVVANDLNQTLKTVWKCLDSRLNAAPLPTLSYPPPDTPIQGPANLYYGTVAFVAANGWVGGSAQNLWDLDLS